MICIRLTDLCFLTYVDEICDEIENGRSSIFLPATIKIVQNILNFFVDFCVFSLFFSGFFCEFIRKYVYFVFN
jgi:hypothetical protein